MDLTQFENPSGKKVYSTCLLHRRSNAATKARAKTTAPPQNLVHSRHLLEAAHEFAHDVLKQERALDREFGDGIDLFERPLALFCQTARALANVVTALEAVPPSDLKRKKRAREAKEQEGAEGISKKSSLSDSANADTVNVDFDLDQPVNWDFDPNLF